MRTRKPTTVAFVAVVGMTLLVWVLRGLGWLSFLPGLVLWLLILLCVATGLVAALQ